MQRREEAHSPAHPIKKLTLHITRHTIKEHQSCSSLRRMEKIEKKTFSSLKKMRFPHHTIWNQFEMLRRSSLNNQQSIHQLKSSIPLLNIIKVLIVT
jgi:hypothetical protein